MKRFRLSFRKSRLSFNTKLEFFRIIMLLPVFFLQKRKSTGEFNRQCLYYIRSYFLITQL